MNQENKVSKLELALKKEIETFGLKSSRMKNRALLLRIAVVSGAALITILAGLPEGYFPPLNATHIKTAILVLGAISTAAGSIEGYMQWGQLWMLYEKTRLELQPKLFRLESSAVLSEEEFREISGDVYKILANHADAWIRVRNSMEIASSQSVN